MATKGRRKLRFETFDQVRADVDALMGHPDAPNSVKTVGKWSLAQICSHLATAFASSLDGYAGSPAPWLLRATMGRIALTSMVRFHFLPEGAPLPKDFLPPAELDLQVERQKFFREMQRFETGRPIAGHPFFGPMTLWQWNKFHLVHCEHHLSFASV